MEPIIQSCINAVVAAVKANLMPQSIRDDPNADMTDTVNYYTAIIPPIVAQLRTYYATGTWPNGSSIATIQSQFARSVADAMIAVISPDAPLSPEDDQALMVHWINILAYGLGYISGYTYFFDATLPPDGSGGTVPDPLPGLGIVVGNTVGNLYSSSAMPISTGDKNTLGAFYNVSISAFTTFARQNQGLLHA